MQSIALRKTARSTSVTAIIVLVGVATVTPMALAHPRHKAPPKCPPANEGMVAADAQAVIYKATPTVYEPEERKFVEGQEEIFGCAHGAKHSYHMGLLPYGGPEGSGGVGPIALTGQIVAYNVGEVPGMEALSNRHSVEEIWVRNLRTGKLIHRMPNGSPAEPGDIGLGETTTIVVKNDGSVAWIVRAGEKLGGIQVRSVDKTGNHVLAISPEINPTSLALAGSTLYWTQGDKPMSATLN